MLSAGVNTAAEAPTAAPLISTMLATTHAATRLRTRSDMIDHHSRLCKLLYELMFHLPTSKPVKNHYHLDTWSGSVRRLRPPIPSSPSRTVPDKEKRGLAPCETPLVLCSSVRYRTA